MATVQQFEDPLAFKKARELTRGIYKAFKNSGDRGFNDQIQRASVSVMGNIAEGFKSGTRQEFLNYLYIAKGSEREVPAQLYAAHDIGYVNIGTFKSLNSLALECSKLISSFITSLKKSPHAGLQYKKEKTSDPNQMWLEEELRKTREKKDLNI